MRRRRKTNPLFVTSFRLPPDVKAFMHEQAVLQDRTMSYILVQIMRMYRTYLEEKKKQPKIKTGE